MELKIFGKNIFEFTKNKGLPYLYNATESLEKSKYLPDFHTMRAGSNNEGLVGSWADVAVAVPVGIINKKGKIKEIKKTVEDKPKLTPKNVFEMKLLHDESFKINTDEKYVNEQIEQFKDKLNLIKSTEWDMSRGTNEIASVLIRLENRKKYPEFNSFFEQYAYTTTTKIDEVIKNHGHLKLGNVEQFMADLPKDAIKEMKDYTSNTEKLCTKKPIFYIIADKKDFEKTVQRRDPILLAQSPFGHFWQILGAWDEEMIFLEEL